MKMIVRVLPHLFFLLLLSLAFSMPVRQAALQNSTELQPEEEDMIQETSAMIQCFESGMYCENFCCYDRYRGDPMCDPGCLPEDAVIQAEEVGGLNVTRLTL